MTYCFSRSSCWYHDMTKGIFFEISSNHSVAPSHVRGLVPSCFDSLPSLTSLSDPPALALLGRLETKLLALFRLINSFEPLSSAKAKALAVFYSYPSSACFMCFIWFIGFGFGSIYSFFCFPIRSNKPCPSPPFCLRLWIWKFQSKRNPPQYLF